jgi:hypothetical protein
VREIEKKKKNCVFCFTSGSSSPEARACLGCSKNTKIGSVTAIVTRKRVRNESRKMINPVRSDRPLEELWISPNWEWTAIGELRKMSHDLTYSYKYHLPNLFNMDLKEYKRRNRNFNCGFVPHLFFIGL